MHPAARNADTFDPASVSVRESLRGCVCVYLEGGAQTSLCSFSCSRAYVLAHMYTHTHTLREQSASMLSEKVWHTSSMVSEHSSIPRGISHLPRSGGALSSIWQIASPKCYILYFPAATNSLSRARPPFSVGDNALLMRMKFACSRKDGARSLALFFPTLTQCTMSEKWWWVDAARMKNAHLSFCAPTDAPTCERARNRLREKLLEDLITSVGVQCAHILPLLVCDSPKIHARYSQTSRAAEMRNSAVAKLRRAPTPALC